MKPGELQQFPHAVVQRVDISHVERKRTVGVRCPFCAGLHEHDWPLGTSGVGLVKASCRDLYDKDVVGVNALLHLLEYAAAGTNMYRVIIGRGFRSDCEPKVEMGRQA